MSPVSVIDERITNRSARKYHSERPSLVLIAPALAYRQLANRLDHDHPVIGITPPSLEHLSAPLTFEHAAAECIRMLRRVRPLGPYAVAGWGTDSAIALEMARLLDEKDSVSFLALIDTGDLFGTRKPLSFLRASSRERCRFTEQALKNYLPHPWYGKILHISTGEESKNPRFDWNQIAPHGLLRQENRPNQLPEILATQLQQK